jgi:hypothetical protein
VGLLQVEVPGQPGLEKFEPQLQRPSTSHTLLGHWLPTVHWPQLTVPL